MPNNCYEGITMQYVKNTRLTPEYPSINEKMKNYALTEVTEMLKAVAIWCDKEIRLLHNEYFRF